jgi:hypothetical protein
MRLFDAALEETRPSVPPEMEEEYRKLLDSLKRENPRGLRRIGFGRDDAALAAAAAALGQPLPVAPLPAQPPPAAPPPLARRS